jgi:nickel/cobalt transporter (NicO) family protein
VSAGKRRHRVRRNSIVAGFAAAALMGALAPAAAQFASLGSMHPAPANGLSGWLLGQQAFFYRALAATIHAAKSDGSAYWALMGVSFVYGIFHAAGPGHGKAVISSYLLANEETWRRGVTLSFASAVLQSLAAVAIVAIAALLIGATAKMTSNTVDWIETVSYALIIVIGGRLVWVKAKSFRSTLHKARASAALETAAGQHDLARAGDCSHDHCQHSAHSNNVQADHDRDRHETMHARHLHCSGHAHHDHDDAGESLLPWGHAHGPQPEQLAGPGGWRRGLGTIVAVGLRPCSGAIIVLVFALAQGLFWAGVASTFVMGLGTAITVGTIASLAVGAKSLAKRLSARRSGYGVLVLRGFEIGAACLVMLVGVALLTGYMASERMGFF